MATAFQRMRTAPGEGAVHAVVDTQMLPLSNFHVAGRVALDRARSLVKLVEGEIVPRLLAGRRAPAAATLGDCATGTDIERFTTLALNGEAHQLLQEVETLVARGVAAESILVDILAPAARQLGTEWEEDRRDFVEVTMGLWRLQEAVHEVSRRDGGSRGAERQGRAALFSALPGDDHSFGTVVIEEIFARDGWATERLADPALSDLYGRLDRNWFDLLGLTVTCDAHTGALPSVIKAVRSVSRNPRLVVLVGGRVFTADPSLAAQVGADGTAADARDALTLADRLVGAVAREERLPA